MPASRMFWAVGSVGGEEVWSHGARWLSWQRMGPGGVGVQAEGELSANCRVCLLHVWALPSWHSLPSPCYWSIPWLCPLDMSPLGRRRAWAPEARSNPCCLGPGFLEQGCLWSHGLVPWCPVAEGSMQAQGLEVYLAVRPGGAEDTCWKFARLGGRFVSSGQDLGLRVSWVLLLVHFLVPAVARSPCPTSFSRPCLFVSPGS